MQRVSQEEKGDMHTSLDYTTEMAHLVGIPLAIRFTYAYTIPTQHI